jgi:hypothetical protein
MEALRRYIIQVDWPDKPFDLGAVRSMLTEAGLEVDDSYRPVSVNPKLGRYVLRGQGSEEARTRAESIPGVRLFPDSPVRPV